MRRVNGIDARLSKQVPTAMRSKKPEMSWPNTRLDIAAKKKALRPKPDSGNAEAVPRWLGQLYVATRVLVVGHW